MQIIIDTEKDNEAEIDAMIAFAATYYPHLKKHVFGNAPAKLSFDNAQRASIDTIYFGFYDKRADSHWYKVSCIVNIEGDVCATPEACQSWLNKQYQALIKAINK